jgi:DNA-binding CsgD family transcriptional regulator
MLETELATLIGDIYDAALEPALWAGVLEKSSRFVGIDVTNLLLEKFAPGYAPSGHELGGVVDDAVRHRMTLLTPHMRRAVLIGETILSNKAEAATLADTLDRLAAGVFLVDLAGRLVQANRSGQAMIATESALRVAGGRLIAIDPAADRALREALASEEESLAVLLPANDGQRFVAHILRLISGTRPKADAGYAAAAAVFVRRAAMEVPAAPEVIARLYGLTPGELRVLLAVFESGGVPDVAAALGISQGTAKTHLRRLFAKTGTKRQADLVKLVAGFARP